MIFYSYLFLDWKITKRRCSGLGLTTRWSLKPMLTMLRRVLHSDLQKCRRSLFHYKRAEIGGPYTHGRCYVVKEM